MTLDRVFRPAMPGCAIASPGNALQSEYGTLGCIVRDLPPYQRLYLLSAWHVIANSGEDPLGMPVMQPGTQAVPGDVLGVVSRWGNLVFDAASYLNLFDAAIARVDPGAVTPEIWKLGRPSGLNRSIAEQAAVRMCGATSEESVGVVVDSNYHCAFSYPVVERRAGFQQQILVAGVDGAPFSRGGDSGAGVVDDANRLVGIVLGRAKRDGSNCTVVCPIGPILYALKVALL